MPAAANITVIGLGYKPLDNKARELISDCDVILASRRLAEVYQRYEGYGTVKDKVMVLDNIKQTFDYIHANHASKKIVLLASGDPLFSGIGRRAVEEFGKSSVEIIPDLSSIQIAFSRIKEPWDDALLISLHGGPDPAKRRRLPFEIGDIPFLIEKHSKIAVLTDKENNPSAIARVIADFAGLCASGLTIHVCEKLGYDDERITAASPEVIAKQEFADPNLVIIIRERSGSAGSCCALASFGLSEGEISHSRGLITKDEIRAVTLHKLRLPQTGVFWDIGSGSGSVSIEAARLCPALKVFAVEKNRERIVDITENRKRFGTANIEIIEGTAPDDLITLPPPDRVFIGGGGNRLEEIISAVAKVMAAGIIVVNASRIESLGSAIDSLQRAGFAFSVSQVSVSRSAAVGGGNYLSALNPIFIIKGLKHQEADKIL